MRAMDVMTTDVITVDPETTVQALATLLAERGISGAPVVDASGRLVGIVSEGDLLHRAEIGTARRHRERRRSWWLDHFAAELARDYVKSHGRTVKDIMTRDVVTVTEDTDLGEVAALLEAKRIKRVPVTRDGKVIGIISRANLVRALAATKGAPPREGEDDDRTIRAQQYDPSETNIVCPWHGYEYSIKTGCHQGNSRVRLRKAELTIREGEIYVRT